MPRRKGLNQTKLDAVQVFVEMYTSNNARPPTVREIMDACGFVSSSTTWRYLQRLVESGRLTRLGDFGGWRGYALPDTEFISRTGVLSLAYPEMDLPDWEKLFNETKGILLEYYPKGHGALHFLLRRLKDPREIASLARDVVRRAVNFEESFGERNAGLKNKKV